MPPSASTKLVSSIAGQSDALVRYAAGYRAFVADSRAPSADLVAALRALRDVPLHELSRLHPVLLNELFGVMCSARSGEVGREAFLSMLHIVDW